jgi:glycogen debranching enzyme
MDARVGDRVITPRIGKPVEVQALWVNALWIGSMHRDSWSGPFEKALASFRAKFWNEDGQCLYDVVDVDHVLGASDRSLRPNQVLAVGGLPLCLLTPQQARAVVDCVESELLTPLGLRSLAPSHADYCPRYEGGPAERDRAYHQGAAWPWLMGPFVEAWIRVRNAEPAAIHEARQRFLGPLLTHLGTGGIGHVSEIADGQNPHEPRGCPFQAWSLGELLRLDRRVLAVTETSRHTPAAPSTVRTRRMEPATLPVTR